MYGPAVRRKMMLADERESCINVFGLDVEPCAPGQHGDPHASKVD
jgi:hypothetical protein